MVGTDSTRGWLHYDRRDVGIPGDESDRGSISKGWEFTRIGIDAIMKNRTLIILPLISTLVLGAVLLSFFGVYLIDVDLESVPPYVPVLIIVVFYLVSSLVIVFFNVALIGAAMLFMEGGQPTVGYGIRFACERLGLIIQWALLIAAVDVILALLRRTGGIGEIVSGIGGVAWSVLTFFAVPVLAFERLSPHQAIRRSAQIMKSTWRETFISNLGIWVVFLILGMVAFLPLFVAFVWLGIEMGIIILMISMIYWVLLGALYGGVSGVVSCALYRYAVSRKIHPQLPAEIIINPWA